MSVLSWRRQAEDLTKQVRELQADLAAAREERGRLEWALIQHIVDEETDGERCRDQIVELAAQKVADLLARYQPEEES